MDDWSYDNDRWCFLEPCRVLLCCQWHLGVALNACAHVTDLQWKPGGNVGEIIQWHTSHQNFYSTGQWRVTTACEDGVFGLSFPFSQKHNWSVLPNGSCVCLAFIGHIVIEHFLILIAYLGAIYPIRAGFEFFLVFSMVWCPNLHLN